MYLIMKDTRKEPLTSVRTLIAAQCILNDIINDYNIGRSAEEISKESVNKDFKKTEGFTVPDFKVNVPVVHNGVKYVIKYEENSSEDATEEKESSVEAYGAYLPNGKLVVKDESPEKFVKKLYALDIWIDPNNIEIGKQYSSDNNLYKVTVKMVKPDVRSYKAGGTTSLRKDRSKVVDSTPVAKERINPDVKKLLVKLSESIKSDTNFRNNIFNIYGYGKDSIPVRTLSVVNNKLPELLEKIKADRKVSYWIFNRSSPLFIVDENGNWFHNPNEEDTNKGIGLVLKTLLKTEPIFK